MPTDEPTCPKCGYTQEDVNIHGDHRLCNGPGPSSEDEATSETKHNARIEKLERRAARKALEDAAADFFEEYSGSDAKRVRDWLRDRAKEME